MFVPSTSWDQDPGRTVRNDVDTGRPSITVHRPSMGRSDKKSKRRRSMDLLSFEPSTLPPLEKEDVPPSSEALPATKPCSNQLDQCLRQTIAPSESIKPLEALRTPLGEIQNVKQPQAEFSNPTTASSSPKAPVAKRARKSESTALPFKPNPKPQALPGDANGAIPSSNFVYQDMKKTKTGLKSTKGAETLRRKLKRQRNERWREANGIVARGRRAAIQRRQQLTKEMAHEKNLVEALDPKTIGEMFSSGVDPDFIQSLFDNDSETVVPTQLSPVSLPDSPPSESELTDFLSVHFRHKSFRDGQMDAIQSTLSGQRSIIILPTGSGKSLCYQFPSVYMRKIFGQTALTLVVSPLIALMADQLKLLPPSCRGAALNSNLSPTQAHLVHKAVMAGQIDVLFIAPERLLMYSMKDLFSSVFMVAVDEAHCLSEWSHSFRPAYLRISKLIDEEIKPKSLLALTATATSQTVESITNLLSITNVIRTDMQTGENLGGGKVQRKNLDLFARRSTDPMIDFLEFVSSNTAKNLKGPIIIYVHYKWQTESVSQVLRERGLGAAEGYHGGLSSIERSEIHEKFMQNKLRFVVATIAFGMGIDKQNVRAVIHLTLPKSIENYVQETGRCSRDNQPGFCRCYFNMDDYARIRAKMVSEIILRDNVKRVVGLALTEGEIPDGGEVFETQEGRVAVIPEKIENIINKQQLSLVLSLIEKHGHCGEIFHGFPRYVKLRFFSATMEELARIDEFVDILYHSPDRKNQETVVERSGVATIDVAKAIVRSGMKPSLFMHKLNACARAQKFTVSKSDWCHIVFSPRGLTDERVNAIADTCYSIAVSSHILELNRLDASYALMSRIAIEGIDDPMIGHKLIQEYFEAEEHSQDGNDLVASVLATTTTSVRASVLRDISSVCNSGN